MDNRIVRYFEDREIRAVTSEGNKTTIAGHPAVFNQEIQIGRFFREMIDVGAFDDTDMSDVFLFVNHENQIPWPGALKAEKVQCP